MCALNIVQRMNIMETSHTEDTVKVVDGCFCSELPRTVMKGIYILTIDFVILCMHELGNFS